MVVEHGFLYSKGELRRLKKRLGKEPVAHAKGKGLCPFCEHYEARWRSVPTDGDPGRVEVRVICSQCQRRAVFEAKA